MHLSIWRIAGIVSGFFAIGVAGLFAYGGLLAENTPAVAGLRGVQSPPIVDLLLFMLLVASFMAALVTFPYYLFRTLGLFVAILGDRTAAPRITTKELAGFAASVGCIVLSLWLAHDVLQVTK